MIGTNIINLQKSLFARLKKLDIDVYDHVPHGAKLPYIVIGEPTVSPFIVKVSYGEVNNFTIHVWSNYKGKKECYEVINKILEIISKEKLNNTVFKTELENYIVFDDIDGELKHGVIKLKFYTKN